MADFQEITRRFSEEHNLVVARHRERRADLLAQERATLDNIETVKAAQQRHDAALAKIARAHQQTLVTLANNLEDSEKAAHRAQAKAENAALSAFGPARAAADAAHTAAREKAERNFSDAFNEAMQTTGLEREKQLAAARKGRELALRAADKELEAAKAAADTEQQEGMNEARETAIAAVEAARQKHDVQVEQAARTRVQAEQAAESDLLIAIAAEPLAGPIRQAFAIQLALADEEFERAKADVLARMRAELDQLPGGPTA